MMMLDPALGLLLVAAVALLFVTAGVHKLRDLKHFDEVFAAYGLLAPAARRHLGRVIPFLELIVAAGVLINAARPYAVTLGLVLLLTYATAIGINLGRGRLDLACGCGGPDQRRPIAPWMVWRNIVIAVVSACLLAPWTVRALNLTDAVTVAFGSLTLALIYLCVDQLMDYLRRAAQLRGLR